jgi:hypothetical protein
VGALLKQQQKVVVSEAGKCCRAHENEWIQGYFFGDRGRRRTRAREVFPSAVPLSQRIGENLLSSHLTQTNRPHQQSSHKPEANKVGLCTCNLNPQALFGNSGIYCTKPASGAD